VDCPKGEGLGIIPNEPLQAKQLSEIQLFFEMQTTEFDFTEQRPSNLRS
jgi:hypothetical protein